MLRLGLLQALFEGAMYTFVFLWTPAMSQAGHSIPHGVVFSAFMVSCALGGCPGMAASGVRSHFFTHEFLFFKNLFFDVQILLVSISEVFFSKNCILLNRSDPCPVFSPSLYAGCPWKPS